MGTFEEFVVRNTDSASARISEIPDVFDRVRQSLHRRLNACIGTDGRYFEQLM